MISSKLGVHVIGGTALGLGRPKAVKLVDVSPAYVRQVRGVVGPDCLIVVRWVENGLLDRGADVWFNRHLQQMQAMADPMVAFESANEVADSDAARYSLWELSRMRLMHTMGLRSVVGNWSVGTPDLPVWAMYAPLLAEMRPSADGDIIGLHEYWADYADISNRWHCGRWALAPELAGRPIAITECGRDFLPDIRRGKPGWQLTCDGPTYLADLRAYARLLDSAPNVIGAMVYQVGAIDPRWKPFDVTTIWPRVVGEYAEGGPTVPTITLVHPLRKPRITQRFAENPNALGYGPAGHMGLDYGCVEGTVVRAPCAGICSPGNPTGAYGQGYGEHLWIRGDDNGRTFWVILGHLIRVLAEKGDVVRPGDIVALSGNTGHSTAPHLHLGIETLDVNAGFQDRLDMAYYWQNPESFMQPQPG